MKYVKEAGDIEILNTSDFIFIDYNLSNKTDDNLIWVMTTQSGEEYILDGSDEIIISGNTSMLKLHSKNTIPSEIVLVAAYPNPFNPVTTIGYSIPDIKNVKLEIYDLQGKMIRQLVNTSQSPGQYFVDWDGRNLYGQSGSSGTYIYKLTAGEFSRANKIVFLK